MREKLEAQLIKVEKSLEGHVENFKSGQVNTRSARKAVERRVRQKLQIIRELEAISA